jgi:hypothetical protein
MPFRPPLAAFLGVITLLGIGELQAQTVGPYIGITYGGTWLTSSGPGFAEPSPSVATALVGFIRRRGLGVEARVSRFDCAVTQASPGPLPDDAPYTIGVRSTILEANIGYRMAALRVGPVQPAVSVGAQWARVVDTWQSDTPEEQSRASLPGLTAAVGLEAALSRHFALVGRGSYRKFLASSARPERHLGLRGPMWEVGMRVNLR